MGQGILRTTRGTAQICNGISHNWARVERKGTVQLLCRQVISYSLVQGVSVEQYQSSTQGAAAAGGPPPPPPPPPPPVIPPPAAPAAPAGGVAAVFAELNKGEEVTKGLRKVDKSQMTHKNPALRAGGTVPSSTGPAGRCKFCTWNYRA